MRIAILSVVLVCCIIGRIQAADWQQNVADLREDVDVLKRRVKTKFDSGISAETNDLQVQSGKRGESIRELNIRLDDLSHQIDEGAVNFDKINRDIEIRIKMLEGKQIPAELSAPVPNIPTIFDAPVANEAARTVVGDEIQGGDLAPIEEYDYNYTQFDD
ncbi:MAG: hypothetical protein IJ532_03905 [Alphaproteobacteria bacterium]|nr:hypothetical protein [Alphaproteobacteria bacterium]